MRGYENLWVKIQTEGQFGWINLLALVDNDWHQVAKDNGLVTPKTERERRLADGMYNIANELVGKTALRDIGRRNQTRT